MVPLADWCERTVECTYEERDTDTEDAPLWFNAPDGSTPVWKSNLQPDFNVRVCDRFDASTSAVLRELDESNRSVQKSAESTPI